MGVRVYEYNSEATKSHTPQGAYARFKVKFLLNGIEEFVGQCQSTGSELPSSPT